MKLDILYKGPAREAFAHLLAVSICTGILLLFAALTYSRITLPRYTTEYTEKDVQQVVNLVITILATVFGILFSHCRRLTNEAETKSELHHEKLTIPRLHVHFEAASGSKVAMGIPVARNKAVWRLVAFYFLTMIMFAFVHSVLSVIFVIDAVISDKGEAVPVAIPLSVDVPTMVDGVGVDPCVNNINSPGCTYVMALTALTSQFVSYQPYLVAGVTFDPINGTLGLPYHAMKHFSDEVASNKFEDAHRRYCLPVLDPHIIKCTEVLINHTTCESIEPGFVKFKSLNVSDWNFGANETRDLGTGLYKISSPWPASITNYSTVKLRIDNQGKGVMFGQVYYDDPYTTAIGAANAWGEVGYASLLHRLMYYGEEPDVTDPENPVPDGATYDFAARCKLTSITNQDNLASSWRQVDFTLRSGVLRANVTEERCPNARAAQGFSGFGDLQYALELAGAIVSSPDGYFPYFNEHPRVGDGTHIFANMSRFDAIANQIYHTIQTAYTQSSYEYSSKVPRVSEEPITMISYPHLFVIRISWTPTTFIGLVLSLLVTLTSYLLAIRWVLATYNLGLDTETWNLLRPVELMAYSLAASQDLIGSLNTSEHRKKEMRGTTRTVLREYPMALVRLVGGQRHGSESNSSTATSPIHEYEQKTDEAGHSRPGVSVRERGEHVERNLDTDVERGTGV